MTSARSSAWWAPPGLPPAVARAARDRRGAAKGGIALLVVGVLFAVLRGVRPDDAGFVLSILAFLGALSAFLVVKLLRAEVLAGPGWLSTRELVRRRWVRSDQLASVKVRRSGIENVLVLTDKDGRRASLVMADLRLEPAVQKQVAHDVRTSLQAGADVPPAGRALLLDDAQRR